MIKTYLNFLEQKVYIFKKCFIIKGGEKMTPIEIFALIVVILGVIKLIVIAINANSWTSVVRFIFAKPMLTGIVSLVLAAVVLYYLLAEISIVYIFGVMLFFMFIMLASYAVFSKELINMLNSLMKQGNIMKRVWLIIVIWIALIIWVLYALFF